MHRVCAELAEKKKDLQTFASENKALKDYIAVLERELLKKDSRIQKKRKINTSAKTREE
jgi:hypothetical protein